MPHIADIKKLVKNKDSAATVIASIPLSFDFYKTGLIWWTVFQCSYESLCTKNGLTYLYAAAEYADLKKQKKQFSGRKGMEFTKWGL